MARLRGARAAVRALEAAAASPVLSLMAPPGDAAGGAALPTTPQSAEAAAAAAGSATASSATPLFKSCTSAMEGAGTAPISPALRRARDAPAVAARWAAVREELELVREGHKGLASGLARTKCALSVLGRQLTPSPGQAPSAPRAAAASAAGPEAGPAASSPVSKGKRRGGSTGSAAAASAPVPPVQAARSGPGSTTVPGATAGHAMPFRVSPKPKGVRASAARATTRPISSRGSVLSPAGSSLSQGRSTAAPCATSSPQPRRSSSLRASLGALPSAIPRAPLAAARCGPSPSPAPGAAVGGSPVAEGLAGPTTATQASATPASDAPDFAFAASQRRASCHDDSAAKGTASPGFRSGAVDGGSDSEAAASETPGAKLSGPEARATAAGEEQHSPVRSFAADLAACEAETAAVQGGDRAVAAASVRAVVRAVPAASAAPPSPALPYISCVGSAVRVAAPEPLDSTQASNSASAGSSSAGWAPPSPVRFTEAEASQEASSGPGGDTDVATSADSDGAAAAAAAGPMAAAAVRPEEQASACAAAAPRLSDLLSLTPGPAASGTVAAAPPRSAASVAAAAVGACEPPLPALPHSTSPRGPASRRSCGSDSPQRLRRSARESLRGSMAAIEAIDWGSVLGVLSGAVAPPVAGMPGVQSRPGTSIGDAGLLLNSARMNSAQLNSARSAGDAAAINARRSPRCMTSPVQQPDWSSVLGLLGCGTPGATPGVAEPTQPSALQTSAAVAEGAVLTGDMPWQDASTAATAMGPLQPVAATPAPTTGSTMTSGCSADVGDTLAAMLFDTPGDTTPAPVTAAGATPATAFSAAVWLEPGADSAACAAGGAPDGGAATLPPAAALVELAQSQVTQVVCSEEVAGAGEQEEEVQQDSLAVTEQVIAKHAPREAAASSNGCGAAEEGPATGDGGAFALPDPPRAIRTRPAAAAVAAGPQLVAGAGGAAGSSGDTPLGACSPYREFKQLRRRAVMARAAAAGAAAVGAAIPCAEADGAGAEGSECDQGPALRRGSSGSGALPPRPECPTPGSDWSVDSGRASPVAAAGGWPPAAGAAGGGPAHLLAAAASALEAGGSGGSSSGGAPAPRASRFGALASSHTAEPSLRDPSAVPTWLGNMGLSSHPVAHAHSPAVSQGALLDRAAESALLTPSAPVPLVFGPSSGLRGGANELRKGTRTMPAAPEEQAAAAVLQRRPFAAAGEEHEEGGVRQQQEEEGVEGGLARSLSGLLEKYRRQAEQTARVLSSIGSAATPCDRSGGGGCGGAADSKAAGAGDGASAAAAPQAGQPSPGGSLSFGGAGVCCGTGAGASPASVTGAGPASMVGAAAGATTGPGPVQALVDAAESLTPLLAALAAPRSGPSASPYAGLDTQALLALALSPVQPRNTSGATGNGVTGAAGAAGSAAAEIRALLHGSGGSRRDQWAGRPASRCDTKCGPSPRGACEAGMQVTPLPPPGGRFGGGAAGQVQTATGVGGFQVRWCGGCIEVGPVSCCHCL
jgi:hypothetical protein